MNDIDYCLNIDLPFFLVMRAELKSLQCIPDIWRSCISWINHVLTLDPISGVTYFMNFADAQEHDIFLEISVTPWTHFTRDNFSQNLIITIAFVLVHWRQFYTKSTQAYLSMKPEIHALRWAGLLGGALTSHCVTE